MERWYTSVHISLVCVYGGYMPVKVQVTFKDDDAAALQAIATKRGIGFATLVRLIALAWLRFWRKRNEGDNG